MSGLQKLGGEAMGERSSTAKVAIASWIGNSIEYYDFGVYGTAAALVFNKLFFPSLSPIIGTLAAFATFGVGFLARPLGGAFFGHYGDKIGRKPMLVITLLVMGLATFLIGLLPPYSSIGVLAPILLVVLRLVQGFGVGGEWGGAMTMVVEHAQKDRRGFYGSWPQTGGFSATLLSAAMFAIVSLLPKDAFLTWGWRIPFLISIVLIGVGLYIRTKIDETPVFTEVKETGSEDKSPLLDVIRTQYKSILLVIFLRLAESVPYYVLTVFALSYATRQLHIASSTMLTAVIIASLLAFPAHLLWGGFSDKVGRRPLYIWGALLAVVLAFPFFWMLETRMAILIWLGYILYINFAHNAINAVQPSFFTEMFSAKVRYSGASLGAQLGAVVAGGFAPFIAAALVAASGGSWTYVAVYLAISGLISAVAAYLAPETYRRDISISREPGAVSSPA
jgi:metabolite-proton symporter